MFVMTEENKKLLEEVIKDRLTKSMSDDADEAEVAFREAMEAIDRQTTIDKNILDSEVEVGKTRKDMIIKVVEIGAIAVVAPLIETRCKAGFAHMICEFEKEYNFTTMAGKSLSALFKFKK